MTFLDALAEQRWDDHRFYHHSRINQSLHLASAISFLVAYGLLAFEPAAAALIAWLFAMPSRQLGHFFFEPRDYDIANDVSHDYKEAVKVGYNLRRKVVLMSIWVLSPLMLLADPALGGLLAAPAGWWDVANSVALVWLVVGIGAVFFRTVQLFFLRDIQTGLVWFVKILTDPFHDIAIYARSPVHVLKGEFYDPIIEPGIERRAEPGRSLRGSAAATSPTRSVESEPTASLGTPAS